PARAKSESQLRLGMPVQFCTAVKRNPTMIAAAKPNIISCWCHQIMPPCGETNRLPCQNAAQRAKDINKKTAPNQKNGLNASPVLKAKPIPGCLVCVLLDWRGIMLRLL